MLILYCTYIDRKIFPDKYVQFISDYNQKRIKKMTTARNLTLNQIITGELLLNNVLKRHYSICNCNASISRTPNGKPYFTNNKLQFSISHSGYIVLCGCDDKKIGVDVQEKKNNSLYNPYTLSAIEAYFKMQEKIINSNSLHWKVDNEKNYNISSISDENIKYYIYQKTVVNDKYIISVSTPRKLSGGIKINKIKYTDLLNENFYERVSENNE